MLCHSSLFSLAGFLRSFVLLVGATIWLASAPLRAQCQNQWLPGSGAPGTDALVSAMLLRDPDGAGPAATQLVLAGSFQLAGNQQAARIGAYDTTTAAWSTFGSGLAAGSSVAAMVKLPNGDLIIAGRFSSVGGVPAANVARWNGSAWSPLGSGLGQWQRVRSLAVLPNGDLVAGGDHVSRWNGSQWVPLGSIAGPGYVAIDALAVLPNGHLVAGGSFAGMNGVFADNIALWNGTTWSSMQGGVVGGIYSMVVTTAGDLIVGGPIFSAGGQPVDGIAQWSGGAWSALAQGTGPQGAVFSLVQMPNGHLLASGYFQLGNAVVPDLRRWDGAAWSAFGQDNPLFEGMVYLPNGDLVGAVVPTTQTAASAHVVRWDGTSWTTLAEGLDGQVRDLAVLPNGELVAGGDFARHGGIARGDGVAWASLGGGAIWSSLPGSVYALAVRADGRLFAGGQFDHLGGLATNFLASYDGTAWSPVGSPLPYMIDAITWLPNGDLVVGGPFTLLRQQGATWVPLGANPTNGGVAALATMPNGDLVAAGDFAGIGGVSALRVARWNGVAWAPLGLGMDASVMALAVLPNGDLVAGGWFHFAGATAAASIARWNGLQWSPLGSGMNGVVRALHVLPDGDLLAGGDFTVAGGVNASNLARWNGTSWSAVAGGLRGPGGVACIRGLPSGEVVLGGTFHTAGAATSAFVARLSTSCLATAVSYGAGCAGPVGTMQLASVAQPWLGGSFTSSCSGFASGAVGAALLGFGAQNTPLPLLHPLGAPGCSLLAATDWLRVLLPSAGFADWTLPIPADPRLLGAVMNHQVVQAVLGAGGAPLGLYASNGLQLTLGSF